MSDLEQRVTDVIRFLAPGEVVTYGDIAEVAGYPGRARAVGRILAMSDGEFAWWRVVNAAGRLVPGHETEQAELLRGEGVTVEGGRVRSARFSGRRA